MKAKQIQLKHKEHSEFTSISDDDTSISSNTNSSVINSGKQEPDPELQLKPMATITLSNPNPTLINSSNLIRHKGNTYQFLFDEDNVPKIVLGPHWFLFIPTYLFFCFVTIAYFVVWWKQLTFKILLCGIIIGLTQNLSFLYTGLINPGFGNEYKNTVDYYANSKRYCNICNIDYDRTTTTHCQYCDVCIYGMDHHCPWTGKCIGAKNLCSFYLFIGTTFMLIFYFFLALVFSAVNISNPFISESQKH